MQSNSSLKREQKIQETLKKVQNLTHKERAIDAEISIKSRERNQISKEKKILTERLKELQVKTITITDHAIIRYLERFCEYDIETIRQHILQELENSDYKTVNGLEAVVNNNSLITIKL